MKIRRAKIEDMIFLFDLRNDATVRQAAFNAAPIAIDTHTEWLKRRLNRDDTIILIAEKNNMKIGQIRFDILDNIAEVDVAIGSAFRGKGYGVDLLKKGCKYAFENCNIKKIVAHIKLENTASINLFSKAGFTNLGHVDFENHKCIEMALKID